MRITQIIPHQNKNIIAGSRKAGKGRLHRWGIVGIICVIGLKICVINFKG